MCTVFFSHRQAPFKFILLVAFVSFGLETPRFFQFQVVTFDNFTDFETTALMEDPVYIQFSSYWDELLTTGAVPLIALIFFNLRMILKIRESSRFSHRFVGRGSSNPAAVRTVFDLNFLQITCISFIYRVARPTFH